MGEEAKVWARSVIVLRAACGMTWAFCQNDAGRWWSIPSRLMHGFQWVYITFVGPTPGGYLRVWNSMTHSEEKFLIPHLTEWESHVLDLPNGGMSMLSCLRFDEAVGHTCDGTPVMPHSASRAAETIPAPESSSWASIAHRRLEETGARPYDAERSKLADECGRLRDENRALLQENAQLRRASEKLQRDLKKVGRK